MPLPATKVELLESLQQAYIKLDSEFDVVNSRHERQDGIEGNISCCDIVSYQRILGKGIRGGFSRWDIYNVSV